MIKKQCLKSENLTNIYGRWPRYVAHIHTIMTFKEKIELMKTKMFDLISTKEITFLNELDKRIKINKFGKFYYKNLEFGYTEIWRFLLELEDNKVYVIIPLLSKNSRPDQPYIVLSHQILITNNSKAMLLAKYISSKFNEVTDLYGITDPDNLSLVFKYKQININFNEHSKF